MALMHHSFSKGMTLIETIVYIALFTTMISVFYLTLFSYASLTSTFEQSRINEEEGNVRLEAFTGPGIFSFVIDKKTFTRTKYVHEF